jgi:hypothetical protein
MLGFEIREKLPCRANLPVFHIFESLANSFLRAGARGNIKEALIRLGVLHDGNCLGFHGLSSCLLKSRTGDGRWSAIGCRF